jgi:membrane carboxypeptidase/penicillin-binding protein
MRKAVAAKPVADFPRPDTVVSVTIDPSTGFLATPDCPRKLDEFYIAGTEPSEYCPRHGGTAVKALPAPLPPPDTDGPLPETGADGTQQDGKE